MRTSELLHVHMYLWSNSEVEKWKNPKRSALFARYHPPAGRGLPTTILHIRHRPSWSQFYSGGRTFWCPPSYGQCKAGCKNVLPPLASRRRYAHSRALAEVVGKPLPAGGWYLAKSALLVGFFHFSSFPVVYNDDVRARCRFTT